MSNTNQSSIYRRTLIKDAGSYVLPILIVLAAILFSMGNIYSVNAAEKYGPIPEPGEVSIPHETSLTGSIGIQIDDSSGSVEETSTGVNIP